MPRRLSIYVGEDLIERLAGVKSRVNVSRVCAEALEREIERAEQEAARDAYREAQSDYIDTLRLAPLLVKETSIEYPPNIARKVANMPPHEASEYRKGWTDTAGTVNPWTSPTPDKRS